MSDGARSLLAEAIHEALNALRYAISVACQAAPTEATADALADSAEDIAYCLRAAIESARPFTIQVAGVFYALGDPPRLGIQAGDQLTLRRDPANQYDGNAVGLYASCGTRVGYLPRAIAADLAQFLDEGLTATAEVTEAIGARILVVLSGTAVDACGR